MEWSPEGYNGTKGAKSSDGQGYWKMRLDYDSWTAEGQKFYIYRRKKMNFVISSDSQNWKTWRMWPTDNGYPNIYAAVNNGRVYVENFGPESGYWGAFNDQTTDWVTEEFIGRASSAINVKDGLLTIRYDGRQMASGSLMTRSDSQPAYMHGNYVVHGQQANKELWSPPWNSNNRMWVDDVYVDTTWARVFLANGPTYSGATKITMQIPTAWSDGTISVQANTTDFPSGSTAYLYVIDKDGNVNQNGFPVTVGASGTTTSTNKAPTVDAGPAVSVKLSSSAVLNGSVSDDGLPKPPGRVTSVWKQVSGPGNVKFDNANSPTTTASFTMIGTYVLRLQASDGALNAQGDVTVTVSDDPRNNKAPVVNPGTPLTVGLHDNASLHADVQDDGLPQGGNLKISWSKKSGPGNVIFGSPDAAQTTASFSQAGPYVLQISANDGELVTTKLLAMNVIDVVAKDEAVPFKNVFNPTNEKLQISFDAKTPGSAVVKIFERRGNLVKTLNQSCSAGLNAVPWDGRNDNGSIVASGIYMVSISVGPVKLPTKKIVVLK